MRAVDLDAVVAGVLTKLRSLPEAVYDLLDAGFGQGRRFRELVARPFEREVYVRRADGVRVQGFAALAAWVGELGYAGEEG